MEDFVPYLLPLVLLPLSLYLIFSIRKKGSDDRKNLPPGSTSWVGENLELALIGYQKFIRDRRQKHTPDAFKTSMLGEKTVVLCGAEGNKFVFTNDNKLVIPWLPLSLKKALLPEFGESNFKEPVEIFRNMRHEVLKPESLKQYTPVMDEVARGLIDEGWNPNSVVKVLPWSKKYSFKLSCRLFMNVVDPEVVDRLLEPFRVLSSGMVSMPINLPGTEFNGAAKAGRRVREEMMRIVKERRKEMQMQMEKSPSPSQSQDILSKMLLLIGEDSKYDSKIANFFVGLMVVSYETTSSSVTAVINYLAQLPHIYQGVLKEQMEIAKSKGPNDLLTWEDVEKMKYSWNVARESLRLIPPTPGAFREAATELNYAGFTIPKGWKIYWTPHSSHMNPDYFPEPEKFDPSRFEGTGPPPYSFIPFGGGSRMCPGRDYGKVAILVFMHNVVTRFRLEKSIPNEKILFHARPTPAHGLPIHLHPHPHHK
ncbi:hypothetical protein C2S51_019642 [Perilla frutescens var. frutescens]|nr:hypothetical protein C2S51_019642 [Perilla frutescens var. frutescens]